MKVKREIVPLFTCTESPNSIRIQNTQQVTRTDKTPVSFMNTPHPGNTRILRMVLDGLQRRHVFDSGGWAWYSTTGRVRSSPQHSSRVGGVAERITNYKNYKVPCLEHVYRTDVPYTLRSSLRRRRPCYLALPGCYSGTSCYQRRNATWALLTLKPHPKMKDTFPL